MQLFKLRPLDNYLSKKNFKLRKRSEHVTIIYTGTLYTGLADGRIVKLEGGKVVDVVRTGKPPCGMYIYLVIVTGFLQKFTVMFVNSM